MFFIYLSVGLVLVLALHTLLTFLSKAHPRTIRHAFGAVFIGLILILIVLFLRFGLPHMAAILSFAAVLVPLIQRFRSTAHARNSSPDTAPRKSRMTTKEASKILGVDIFADEKTIREAHRRLIYKNHPDAGGSAYLASQINEARDILLAQSKKAP